MQSKKSRYVAAVERAVEYNSQYAIMDIERVMGYLNATIADLNELGYLAIVVKFFGVGPSISLQARQNLELLLQNILYDYMLLAIIGCKAEDHKKYAEYYLDNISEKIHKSVFYAFRNLVNLNYLGQYLERRGKLDAETHCYTPSFVRTKETLANILDLLTGF